MATLPCIATFLQPPFRVFGAMVKTRLVILMLSGALIGSVANGQEFHTEVVERNEAAQPWQRAPTSFRGVAFGASEQQAEAVLGRMRCDVAEYYQKHGGGSVRSCSPKDRLVLGDVKLLDEYLFRNGALVAVNLWYRESLWKTGVAEAQEEYRVGRLYPIVRAAFIEKFGEPSLALKMEHKGTERRTPERADLFGKRQSGPDQIVSVVFYSYAVEWQNESMHIYLDSSRENKFGHARVETVEWQRFRESIDAERGKSEAAKF